MRHDVAFGARAQGCAHLKSRDFRGCAKARLGTQLCKDLFRNTLNENADAWDALGPEYHRRLERNYVTWVHQYVRRPPRPFAIDELRRRPVVWTVGGLTPTVGTIGNFQVANATGIPIGLLMCRHFPQVSIPETLADHIAQAARA